MRTRSGRHVALAWCLCVLAAAVASGQEEQPAPKIDPKADEVMRQVSDFYAGLKSVAFAVTTTVRVEAQGRKQEMATTDAVAMRRPDRLAVRLVKGMVGGTLVCDGQSVYTHMPFTKKYTVKKAPSTLDALFQQPEALFVLGSTRSMLPLSLLLTSEPYLELMRGVTAGDYVGTEEIEGTEYHHLKFYQEEMDWEIWVQAGEQPLVHKIVPDVTKMLAQARESTPGMAEMKMETTVRFEKWAVNPNLPDGLFVFTPPADAEKVESLFGEVEVEEASPLLGKPAPPFKLKLLDGGEVDLVAHKDKDIVILDFWATWCGPCRRAMPIIAEVAGANKHKGVVLYAVNQGEPAETVREFLDKQGLKVAVALDEKKEVGALYGVRGIPQTVIIGRDGTVQAVHVGLLPDLKEKLTADLDALLAGRSLAAPEAEQKEAP